MQKLPTKLRIVYITIIIIVCVAAASKLLFTPKKAYSAQGILHQINFQGKLTNPDGTNVADGNYSIVFNIYSVASGGSPIWTESWTGGNQVAVKAGIFRVNLGSITALPGSVNFNTDSIYLGITVGADQEMTPRVRFTSVPQAFNAETVNGLTVQNTSNAPFSLATVLKIADGKTVVINNGLTFSGTDSTSFTFPSTGGNIVTEGFSQSLTNKTIGSTGLTFSGATTDVTTGTNEDFAIVPNGSGLVDINTTAGLASLDVRANAVAGGTLAVASISGKTSFAALLVDNTGVGDIFTASTGGVTKFNINNAGQIYTSNYKNGGGVLYTQTSGIIAQTAAGGNGQCLTSNGTNPLWGSCGAGGGGSNWWTLDTANGDLYAGNQTVDLFVGGNSTASAKFAVLGIADTSTTNNPSASVSAITGNNAGNGIIIAGNGSIQSLRNNTFIVGGGTTGNIQFKPGNSSTSLYLASSGNVGIGTLNPGAALDVAGNILVGANSTIDTRTSGTLSIGTTTASGLSIGRSTVTTTLAGVISLPQGGTAATPVLTFTGDENTGLFRKDVDILSFVANGQPGLSLDGASGVGRFLIGDWTVLPEARLKINDDNNNSASGIVLGNSSTTQVQIYKSASNQLTIGQASTLTMGNTTATYTGAGAVTLSSGGTSGLTLDTSGAAAVNLGNTNATSVVIGSTTNTSTIGLNLSATTGNGLTVTDTALTSGNGLQITSGNPKVNANSGALTSGNLVNVSSANHSFMTLNNRDLTIGGHKNNIAGVGATNEVFVYDASNDVDGGRWTNDESAINSSWYNETKDHTADACVVAATGSGDDRCGQSSFPRKAIIVATNTNVYIFDAKDNSMWMRFDQGTTALGVDLNNDPTDVWAKDGQIYVGTSGSAATGLYVIDFSRDKITRFDKTDARDFSTSSTAAGSISNRNSSSTYLNQGRTGLKLTNTTNSVVNDVKSNVVNGKTYIAVAMGGAAETSTTMTAGNVALINETDQTVAFFTAAASTFQALQVFLTPNGTLYWTNGAAASPTNFFLKVRYNATAATGNNNTPNEIYGNTSTANYGASMTDAATPTFVNGASPIDSTTVPNSLIVTQGTSSIDGKSDTVYMGTGDNLTVIETKQGDPTNGAVKYYTKDYITPDLTGDVRATYPLDTNFGSGLSSASVGRAVAATLTNSVTNPPTYTNAGVRGRAANLSNTTNSSAFETTASSPTFVQPTTAGLTVQAWVHPTAVTTTLNTIQMWVSADDALAGKPDWGFGTKGDGTNANISCFGTDTTATPALTTINTNIPAVNNTWYHVVETFDTAGNIKCFVNGIQIGTGTLTNLTGRTPTRFSIGATSGTTALGAVVGDVDEVTVTAETVGVHRIKQRFDIGQRALNGHASQTLRGTVIGANNSNQLNTAGATYTVSTAWPDLEKGQIYIGTAGTNAGGASVIGIYSDTLNDLITTTATDDTNTAFGNNAVNSVSVSKGYGTNQLFAIAQGSGIWIESGDTSLKEFLSASYNPLGLTINQSNLNVDQVFRVVNQLGSRDENLGLNATIQPNYAEILRADNNGVAITLPVPATNTNTSGTTTFNGLTIASNNAIVQNGTGSTLNFNGSSITTPNITQTAGTITVNGQTITIGTITTGGTQNGINITPSNSNAAGTEVGLNIGNITAGAATENAISIGSGWDAGISGVGGLIVTSTAGNITLQPAGAATTANVQIGAGGAGSTTPDILVVDAKSTTGDPTAVNGGIYYNVADGKLRCGEAAAFRNCTGWEFLGSTSGATSSLGPVTIPARAFLMIVMHITGYAGSATGALRFNSDTGNNYRYRWLTSATGSTTFAAGANLAATTSCVKVGPADTVQSRDVVAYVTNDAARTEKLVLFDSETGTGAVGTQSSIDLGNGAWVSGASTQITSVTLISNQTSCAGTAQNFSAATGFEVYGRNF